MLLFQRHVASMMMWIAGYIYIFPNGFMFGEVLLYVVYPDGEVLLYVVYPDASATS